MATLTLSPANLGVGYIGQRIVSDRVISGSIIDMVHDRSFYGQPYLAYDYDQTQREGRNSFNATLVWNGHNVTFSSGRIIYTVESLGETNIYAKVFVQDNDGAPPDCQFTNILIGTVTGIETPEWITPVINRVAGSRTTYTDMNRMVSNASVLANRAFGKMDYVSGDFVYDTEWVKLVQYTNTFADTLGIQRATQSTSFENLNRIENIHKLYHEHIS